MTDNALVYRHGDAYQHVLADLGAAHPHPALHTTLERKVERFIQTLDHEWAHAQIWPSSQTRDRALSSLLRFYNRRRPHTSLEDRPPIGRVYQV